jgi:hypothetical protein
MAIKIEVDVTLVHEHVCLPCCRWVCDDLPELKLPIENNILADYDTRR